MRPAKQTPDTTPPAPAPAGTRRSGSARNWLERRSADWLAYRDKVVFARDHYTGAVLEPGKIERYLVKRAQGESAPAFKERCSVADYTPHFAAIVDSLVGMLGNIDSDANRVFNAPPAEGSDEPGPGLGDPEDPDSIIGRLMMDADGRGTGYLNLFKQLGTDLTVAHKGWVVVDPGPNGDATIRVLPWESVVAVVKDRQTGRIVEVLVCEEVDTRESLDSAGGTEEQYVAFRLEGWQRYKSGAKGEVIELKGPGDFGTHSYKDANGQPELPIFPVELPMRRHAGWSLAKKCNVIFNKESERDHILRAANFPRLNLVGNETAFKDLVDSLNKGSNALHQLPGNPAHSYIAPSSEPATVSTEVLKGKVEQLYITAFREYGDSAQQRTATEVRQEVSSGCGAFLQLLKSALDDAETRALRLVAQVELPREESAWYVCKVNRSDDFLPADADAVIDKLIARVFGTGNKVPLGRSARLEAAKQVAQWQGLTVDEAEIAAAVDAQYLLEAMSLDPTLPVPPQLKARIVAKLAAASGLVKPEEEVKLADGQMVKLMDLIEQEAERMAENRAAADAALGQAFGPPPQKGGPSVVDPEQDPPAED